MEKLKSTGKRSSQFDYNEEFVIKQLNANPNTVHQQEEQLKKMNPNATPEQINRQIMNIVVRENVYNAIMNGIVEYYKFDLNPEEITKYSAKFKEMYKEASPEVLNKLTENMLKKTLVYEDLASLWDIRTTDEETTNFLQNYYKQTNNPIRDIMNNKEQFENFKQMIQDEKTTNEILSRFKRIKFDLPKPAQNNSTNNPSK